jgi:hypothetical protein
MSTADLAYARMSQSLWSSRTQKTTGTYLTRILKPSSTQSWTRIYHHFPLCSSLTCFISPRQRSGMLLAPSTKNGAKNEKSW